MPELRFAITQQQKSVTGWTIDSGISYTWQYWLKNQALTQASFQTLSQPFSGWMTKSSSPCLKTRGTHRSRHSKAWIILLVSQSQTVMNTVWLLDATLRWKCEGICAASSARIEPDDIHYGIYYARDPLRQIDANWLVPEWVKTSNRIADTVGTQKEALSHPLIQPLIKAPRFASTCCDTTAVKKPILSETLRNVQHVWHVSSRKKLFHFLEPCIQDLWHESISSHIGVLQLRH